MMLPELLIPSIMVLVPIVFLLIFQAAPFELLRLRFGSGPPRDLPSVFPDTTGAKRSPLPNSLTLLQRMADTSNKIAEKIYIRAGVYLLFGVMIAFSGLGFFLC
jgi:hypothetical protein